MKTSLFLICIMMTGAANAQFRGIYGIDNPRGGNGNGGGSNNNAGAYYTPPSQSTPAPAPVKRDPVILQCEDIVRDINNKGNNPTWIDSICTTKLAPQVVEAKAELLGCMNTLVKNTSMRSGLMLQCLSGELREDLRTNKLFQSCLDASRNMGLADSHIKFCRDKDIPQLITNPAYFNCFENQNALNPGVAVIENAFSCKKSKLIENYSSVGFSSCTEVLKNMNVGRIERARYCLISVNQSDKLMGDLKACEANVRPITGAAISGVYCVRSELEYDKFSSETMKCVANSASVLAGEYFIEQEKTNTALPLLERLMKSCGKNPKNPKPLNNKDIAFYGAKYLNVNAGFDKTKIGGLSGLSYNAARDTFSVVSDDPGFRNQSRYYEMKINLNQLPIDVQTVEAVLLDTNGGSQWDVVNVDAEGILSLNDGRTVISTESLVRNSSSYLKIYSKVGKQVGSIILDEKFFPKRDQVEKIETWTEYPGDKKHYDIQTTSNVTFYSKKAEDAKKEAEAKELKDLKDAKNDKPAKKDDSDTEKPKNRTRKYWVEEQIGGIQANRSFESLTGNHDGSVIFTGTEAPLVQDILKGKDSDRDIVRIIRLEKTTDPKKPYETTAEYAYELDEVSKDSDNGLVDMVFVGKNKILTLERGYDRAKNKVSSKIFEVELGAAVDYSKVDSFALEHKGNPIKPVSKRLLIDLDDILPSLPGGLDKIDNLEGLAFGPLLPNGNQSLLLVSDNNFGVDQYTQIYVLEYLGHAPTP